eukprot:COSAG06_NODE_10334_length_1699_cov_11.755000_4_plen_117_part_01
MLLQSVRTLHVLKIHRGSLPVLPSARRPNAAASGSSSDRRDTDRRHAAGLIVSHLMYIFCTSSHSIVCKYVCSMYWRVNRNKLSWLPAALACGLIRRGCSPANLVNARHAMAARRAW